MGCKSSDKPKSKHRKGLWSPEEDQRLRNYILKFGHGCWSSVPINAGLQRNGKSCRLRWINYLRPGLKRGTFSTQEEETILTLHRLLGNKWSQIAQHLPGRTDNEVKNYWHSYLKKRVLKAEGLDSPNKTQSVSSNSDNIEISSYESLENMEKLSADTDRSVPQILDSPIEVNKSCLPRLVFAEWLSLDSFASVSDQPMVSNKAVFDNNPNFQDNYMQDYLLNGGAFGSEYNNSLSNGSVSNMFSPQFKFEGQSPGHEFISFGSGEDICSDHFNMSSDLVYI